MKNSIIMKLITSCLLISNFNVVNAQENNFKVHAASIGFGGFHIKNSFDEDGGISLHLDLTTSINNNLISTSYFYGNDIPVFTISELIINEIAIQYGREVKLKKWFALEVYAGLGYYHQKASDNYEFNYNLNSISYPLKLNSKFYFTKTFGIGLNTNYSINKINNNFSTHIIFHFKIN